MAVAPPAARCSCSTAVTATGRPGTPAAATLGPDLASGQVPQHVVPGGHWQAARPAGGAEVLVSCVVAPGFDFADFTLHET